MAVYSIALCLSLILVLQMAAARPSMDAGSRSSFPHLSQMHVDRTQSEEGDNGTTWAILVAGSQGIGNYRHQADVCHAYQILKRGGLKDENIVVFMYDDIANDALNPKPGVIINRPNGDDVYAGVPKDYTGEAVSQENLFAVILGNQSAVTGGSGKVVNSTSNDRIFIFYSDHGGPGALGMPFSFLYAVDLVDVLKKKHASGTYKEMVIYIESCESGSIFEGLLPENLNIYAMTASQANEDSYATYCRWEDFPCLGDLYSVAWMEYSESHNLMNKTISQQYVKVKERTSRNHTYYSGSHVMEYGNESIKVEKLYLYHGFDPSTKKIPPDETESHALQDVVDQRSADLSFLWSRYYKMKPNSKEKVELLKEITSTVLHRQHLDGSLDNIGTSLFGPKQSSSILKGIRKPGMSIVDDWECLKSSVRIFETNCGALTQYGMKHMRAFANVCNSGVKKAAMEEACKAACNGHDLGQRNPAKHGFNA